MFNIRKRGYIQFKHDELFREFYKVLGSEYIAKLIPVYGVILVLSFLGQRK